MKGQVKAKKGTLWVEGEILMMSLSGEVLPEDIEEIAKIGLDLAKKSKRIKYNIIDISGVRGVPISTRKAAIGNFSGPAKKIAFVCKNPVAKIIGSFFLRMYRIPIPARMFSSAEDAKRWFREEQDENNKGG